MSSLALVVGILFYLPMTLLATLQATRPVIENAAVTPGAAATLTWPAYGGSAIGAVGFDGVLAQAGSTSPLPMASITKVVTMLVVLEAKPLKLGEDGPTITMTSSDVALSRYYLSLQGKVAPVRAGLVFTQHELMELSLIDSANNYAASLAVWAYGSMDAYVAAAKSWVSAHQLSSMTITDPTGIDPADTASTTDLLALGKLALANPVIAGIVATKTVTLHDIGTITNTNTLLGSDGVDGIKTGTLNDAGSNLLFASDIRVGGRPVTVVGVVLGGADHDQLDSDIRSLLEGVKVGFHLLPLTTTGQVMGRYTTEWGQQVTAVAERSVSVVTWGNTPVRSSVSAKSLSTGSRGEKVGVAVFTVGTQTLTVPIGLSTALTDPGPGWRLSHPGLIVGSP